MNVAALASLGALLFELGVAIAAIVVAAVCVRPMGATAFKLLLVGGLVEIAALVAARLGGYALPWLVSSGAMESMVTASMVLYAAIGALAAAGRAATVLGVASLARARRAVP